MPNYVWPLSGTTTAPDMNTSFGPRINRNRWDFHDGIDLRAPIGTPVLAMRAGEVHRAGPAGTHGFSSRHVVLKITDPQDGLMFLVHVHLSAIDPAIVQGASVTQGQVIGSVGDDDAEYAHLHFEFRKGQAFEKFSVHPLRYLPYTNTTNFTAPIRDRFNRLSNRMAARLLFGSTSREGDLQRVEVDLLNGAATLGRRMVDVNDKSTVNEGIGDQNLYVNDIGVEGYQKSNLIEDGRTDLHYGILVRNIPAACNRLVARVVDVGGRVATSGQLPVPDQSATNRLVDFEDGAMPPDGWQTILQPSGSATGVENDATAASSSSRGMRCSAPPTANGHARSACIEFDLPLQRFEWIVEGRFRLQSITLAPGQSLRILEFQTLERTLAVAARVSNRDGDLRIGLVASRPDGSLISDDSDHTVSVDGWHHWRVHVCRIGTREATGILSLDNAEQARLNWDSGATEPRRVRAGIVRISGGGAAIVLADDLRVTESTALI